MPVKARYWKNPEKHRLYERTLSRYKVRLGIKAGKTPGAYSRWVEWRKVHNKKPEIKLKRKLYEAKRRAKINSLGFSSGHTGSYLYSRLKGFKKDGFNRFTKESINDALLWVERKTKNNLSRSTSTTSSKANPNNRRKLERRNVLRRKPRKGRGK